jgi:beta-N-acetylhexosaminidase
VERILGAKARLGLTHARAVDVAEVPARLGGRARAALAQEIAARAVTLIKDERGQIPLRLPASARLLLLSAIDYAGGWREGAPGRVLVPELKRRFPETIAVEVSERTTAGEMELIRALARRSDAVVVATQVRIASYSGRMDLSADQKALLEELASDAARPFVVVALGNPYVATLAPGLPAFLLTYEFGDAAEAAAVRALCGEAPIGGKLPISIPDLFPVGHGLVRAAVRPGLPVAASGER